MLAFTDCPIVVLGDVAGKMAHVRQVEILSYDGNKYCQVAVEGILTDIKAGYLYSERGRCGEVLEIDVARLPLACRY